MVHALVHDHAPHELLAVLYTAMLPGMPASMAQIDALSGGGPGATTHNKWLLQGAQLGGDDGAAPAVTTAAFYSVGSPHAATRGLRLGTRVIYSVAQLVASAAPSVATFCTLSPIPDFIGWVQHAAATGGLDAYLSEEDCACIRSAAAALLLRGQNGVASAAPERPAALLVSLTSSPEWYDSPVARSQLRPVLCALVRRYLLDGMACGRVAAAAAGSSSAAARGSTSGVGILPRCKVSRFHLGNGARMFRICWGADPSPGGVKRSGSLMVNYLYSDSGAEGLAVTMRASAALYAAEPGNVLAMQDPSFA